MTDTPRLGITQLEEDQALPEAVVNEGFLKMEPFASRLIVKSKGDNDPPVSPADGDAYLIGGTGTGAWTGHDDELTVYINGAWEFYTPKDGMEIEVEDEDTSYTLRGGSWVGAVTAGIAVEDEGASEGTGILTLNFTGAGVSVNVTGTEAEIAVAGGGSGVDVEDEGVSEATGATTFNFTGAGVTATDAGGGVVDITIPGGGGAAPLSTVYEDQKAANTAGGASTSGSWIARTLNTEVYDDIGLSLHASTVTITNASPGVVTWTAHGLEANSTVVFTTTGALPTGLTAGTTYYVIATGLTANTFQVSASPGGAAINTSSAGSGTHTATASAISLAAGDYEVDATSMFFSSNIARIRLRDITNDVTLALSDNMYGSSTNAGSSAPRILGRFTLAGTAIVELQYRVNTGMASNGLGVLSNFGEIEIYSRLKLTQL